MYGAGQAVGLSPRQVDDLTPWEFLSAIDGWKRVHASESTVAPPTDDEHEALIAKHGGPAA